MTGSGIVKTGPRIAASAIVLLAAVEAQGATPEWVFTKIADTSTGVPNSGRSFAGFDFLPALDAGTVAFLGRGSADAAPFGAVSAVPAGIYTGGGTALSVIADTSMTVPGGGGNFTFGFGTAGLGIGAGEVSFPSISGVSMQPGIYQGAAGKVTAIAGTSTAFPASAENFSGFQLATAADGGGVAFVGFNAQAALRGVFIGAGGGLTTVANHNTLVPDGSGAVFDQFSSANANQGAVAFTGPARWRVYLSRVGTRW